VDGDARAGLTSAPPAFFVEGEAIVAGTEVALGEDAAHHARVRRIEVGARVALRDGAGMRAEGILVRLVKSEAAVSIDVVEHVPPPPAVHLLVPIADRDRMLWLAEKATELALTSWRPVLWQRSRSVTPRGEGDAFSKKVRLRMVSALLQSRGTWLPVIHPDASVTEALGSAPGARLVLDPGGAPMLREALRAPVTLAIGPEGGFEPGEVAMLDAAGFSRAALGGHIMRFETAAVAALAVARAAIDAATSGAAGTATATPDTA
jgi:16S rRNA (uracil1498-N3)-methyltransferase